MTDCSFPPGGLPSTTAPLSESAFLILLSLSERPLHGYAILGKVLELSEGRLDLSTGTLYGALKRFSEASWIERIDSGEADETGRPRKEYRLTGEGETLLRAETARMRSLVSASDRLRPRLEGSPA
jgi:DNA-binding PadR family transcriptional regulator